MPIWDAEFNPLPDTAPGYYAVATLHCTYEQNMAIDYMLAEMKLDNMVDRKWVGDNAQWMIRENIIVKCGRNYMVNPLIAVKTPEQLKSVTEMLRTYYAIKRANKLWK